MQPVSNLLIALPSHVQRSTHDYIQVDYLTRRHPKCTHIHATVISQQLVDLHSKRLHCCIVQNSGGCNCPDICLSWAPRICRTYLEIYELTEYQGHFLRATLAHITDLRGIIYLMYR